jgi:hypothetical protein
VVVHYLFQVSALNTQALLRFDKQDVSDGSLPSFLLEKTTETSARRLQRCVRKGSKTLYISKYILASLFYDLIVV